jgi:hypothetical protein
MQLNLNQSPEDFQRSNMMTIRNVSTWRWDRCLFLSDSGILGLAPGFAVEGVTLCIHLGCRMPLVLRPRDNYYTVVGETYVHGFMHVEAIKLEKGELKARQFEMH